MKVIQLRISSALLGAIALAIVPLTAQGQTIEVVGCPDYFDGIELSDRQKSQLQPLEDQLEDRMNEIMPISPEVEEKWDQLEENFESQIEALLSPQQENQIEALDRWADNQITRIAPELIEEEDSEPNLTPNQEEALEAFEEEYEQRFQSILTPEQQQRIEALEQQFDGAIEVEFLEPNEEQEARIEAAEEEFEQRVMQILTPGQRQQFQRNMICDLSKA